MMNTKRSRTHSLLIRSFALGVALSAGLSATLPQGALPLATAAISSASSQSVYNQFAAYLKDPAMLSQARKYLLNHVHETTPHHATLMVLQLENAQHKDIAAFAAKFDTTTVQQALDRAARKGKLTFTSLLQQVTDKGTIRLLEMARDRGYKLETMEGMYYPVVNYTEYDRYARYVKPDIAAYIRIRTQETVKPSSGDAALLISWGDVVKRALEREQFLDAYPVSNRREAVQELLEISRMQLFYGLNNTPLFDYESGQIHPDALAAYQAALKQGTGDSKLLALLEQFLDVVKSNGGKRTTEVDAFLKKHVE